MAIIPARFFEGQTPPAVHIESIDNIDWYEEMKRRSFEGYSYKGTNFTGDQWFFYNHYPMMVAKKDKHGKVTKEFDMLYPYWSQEDDYLFKQIEEARQSDLDVMLFTGRGYGKTYIVLSIGTKIYYLKKLSHGIISASGDDHANATWQKFRDSITAINKLHPTWRLPLLADNDKDIIAGDEIFTENRWDKETYSRMEKIIYDKKAGKTKGRRLDFQQWEESGDWGGAATLKECIAASEGTWKVGAIKKCRVFYTGTGGTILSTQAKEIFNNPLAYNLYHITTWQNRKTAIWIPSYKKYGGFWETTGISDEEGAKAHIEEIRRQKLLDPDPTAYNKFCQEYPFNPDEMFMQSGSNRFDQKIISKQLILLIDTASRKGAYVNLHWRMKDGKKVGVDIDYTNNGKIWMLEEPEKNQEGIVYPYLYVGGYDGIDVGKEDTSSGQGSSGSISIKKRLLSMNKTNNLYVCHLIDRPSVIDDFFDDCYKIMFLYQALINIEDTKRGIVGHLKREKALRFLMKRPRLTLTDPNAEKESKLIGTTAITKNFEYGENFLAKYIREYGHQMFFVPGLEDLRDFRMDNRTKHDFTVSMMMSEIGDDELMDRQVMPEKAPVVVPEYGYYTDKTTGRKKWGKIPDQSKTPFNFKDRVNYLDSVNLMKNSEEYQ